MLRRVGDEVIISSFSRVSVDVVRAQKVFDINGQICGTLRGRRGEGYMQYKYIYRGLPRFMAAEKIIHSHSPVNS